MTKIHEKQKRAFVNFELFMAKRIATSKHRSFSRLIVRIAIAAIAVSVAVMILSNAVVNGFQHQIRTKAFNFLGHIQISQYQTHDSYEPAPISKIQPFYPHADTLQEVKNIQIFAQKAGIIKTHDLIEGVLLKGIDHDYNWSFLKERLVAGDTFQISRGDTSNKILVSQTIADELRLEVHDTLAVYFIQNRNRARQFVVSGIYNTGLEEYDKLYCLVDIKHIRTLNGWDSTLVGGFEAHLQNIDQMPIAKKKIEQMVSPELLVRTLQEINPNLFDWLKMQNLNKQVILVLMILVATINMITVLLILILERTNMVGVLKALGARDWSVQKIFLYNAAYILLVGLLIGNGLGLGLGYLQETTGWLTLPQRSYYLSEVPILFRSLSIVLINVGTVGVCLLVLILPSLLVTRITPIKAIRFE